MSLGSPVDFLYRVFEVHAEDEAVVGASGTVTYLRLSALIDEARRRAAEAGVGAGAVVALEADFSAGSIAMLVALMDLGAIIVPVAPTSALVREAYLEIAQAEWRIVIGQDDRWSFAPTGRRASNELIEALRVAGHPGLVLFTSGSSGEPKGALHDCTRLMGKYRSRRHTLRTLMFLLFDHIGGIDSLFQALSNGCAIVLPDDRTPDGVCAAIARHRAEVLPAAPSFLALMLLSEADRRHDLSSLRYITYGAEAMPQSTLNRLTERFPGVTLLQKYGLTELGTLRSRSRANDSLWVRIGGEGFGTRVVDGLLQIKAESSMLGYLNAPSPFTDDGWFMTGDAVEVAGDYFRILGRASDLINVAGRKVFPAEVEEVVEEVENVAEAAVSGERHPLTGQVVVATVVLRGPEDSAEIERRVRAHCRARLEAYKVPMKVVVAEGPLHTERHKKSRR